MEVFPRPTSDRRSLPDIPSINTTRRSAGQRFVSGCVIDVALRRNGETRKFKGQSLNLSDSGVAITTTEPLEVGDTARLRFTLPAGLLPEGLESRMDVAAKVVRCVPEAHLAAFHFERNMSDVLKTSRWRRLQFLSLMTLFFGAGGDTLYQARRCLLFLV